jgi:hypothetical protein
MYKMYTRDKHDYDDLNKSSLGVQGPPGSTISRYKANTMVTFLSMASYIHLELERPFKLPCTYEYASGDRDVIFQLSVSSNKSSVVRYLE